MVTDKEKINAYNRDRYAKDPSAQKAASKKWRENHREQYNETAREWIRNNRKRLYDPSTLDGRSRLDKENERKRELAQLRKIEVLTHYGNGELRCVWSECNIIDVDMLTLDHVNNDGAEHRKQLGHNKVGHLYRLLKNAGYPEGYQTLCWNHQLKKEFERKRIMREEKNGKKESEEKSR